MRNAVCGFLAGALAVSVPLGAQHSGSLPVAHDSPVPSQPQAEGITRALVARGFANVATVVDGRRVLVTFENTRFRDPRRALSDVAAQVLPSLGARGELVLVPSVDGVPLGTARYHGLPSRPTPPDSAYVQPRTSLSLSGVPAGLLSMPKASSSYGRVDVVVHPWFQAQFGDFDEPVRSRTGVAPEARVARRRGLRLSAQVLFTLQDNLPTGESRVRPGLVTLGQTMRLPRKVFVHATAGVFTPNRYGADVHARAWSPSGRWFAGAELGADRAHVLRGG